MAEEPSGLSRCVVNKLIKEIRDQKYDEKANKVTIKVVSCSPEKIRDKLCRKGCGCIKSIEIPPPPPPPEKPPQKPPPPPPETHVNVSVDLQVLCVLCYGRSVWDSWCGCGETQPGCSIM
ncbi:hypothetical protein SLEP1_g26008 [Rubroshorea leprosula]|uniref:Uncharacterized protein n=1 Tax=Rubroshorea leprosula TaxID=152421 RepID=A0AAV5JWD5_9ROSI|nr:hypothetical protein SLEP1_g26008 [Rubroshorea leprosula]